MGILEKIADIEREISRTQKNKATEYHLGLLKGKLAKYRAELLEPKGTGPKGEGFDVLKSGDARVALIGFPSVGKSTLLGKITGTKSEAANYEFTTLTCIPGKFMYKGANIQILDLPGIIQGAAEGKGRGRQVIAVARTADLIIMMLDATKSHLQRLFITLFINNYSFRPQLTKELEEVGIRLNKKIPDIYYKGGGISYNPVVKQSQLTERLVTDILHQYRIFNAEVLVRQDVSIDEFIDVVVGNRKYLPCLYVYNKIDQITVEQLDIIAREDYTTVISAEEGLNMDYLKDSIWEHLNLLRVYTKKHSEYPDFSEGLILRSGATVETAGTSTKHNPQRVGLGHPLENEDVIQIVKK
ncbi:Developmentally-regulated GTP-binding protein 2 [Smittium culicis]|uniref:Developmentally-regulated GTP-binding protein 2 n=1 Tax=Smittium culicis TaxID=133412 RepID=A0A1R1YGM5_9FUNG|nr:Developmentally-regulated GTP-binding protein 2 [Smittium culicis]